MHYLMMRCWVTNDFSSESSGSRTACEFFRYSGQGNGHVACFAGFSGWLNDGDLDIAAQHGDEAKQAVYRIAGQLSTYQAGYLGLVDPEQRCRLDLGQATHLDCIRYDMCKAGLYQRLFRVFNTEVGEYITAASSDVSVHGVPVPVLVAFESCWYAIYSIFVGALPTGLTVVEERIVRTGA